jgi:hypothetical protein
MRTIGNRIRKLERRLAPPTPFEGESAAAVLDARRRRRLDAGQSCVDQPRRSWTPSECRKVSLTDVLSGRYREKTAR